MTNEAVYMLESTLLFEGEKVLSLVLPLLISQTSLRLDYFVENDDALISRFVRLF